MINFILVDDSKWLLDHIRDLIDKILFRPAFSKLEYKVHRYEEYDRAFYQIAQSNLENKVYILDIETKHKNGIDQARWLREIDQHAEIIFLTAYDKNKTYINKLLISSIKAFGVINKNNEQLLIERIIEFLSYAMLERMIPISCGSSVNTPNLKEIYYIVRKDRKTLIRSAHGTVEIKKSLKELETILEKECDFFVRSHRSCIVNITKVLKYDFQNRKIIFKSGLSTKYLSRNYKKSIEQKIGLQTKKEVVE